MMNSSAGVPRPTPESASSAGGTWPCGQTSGRSLTAAYSSRATVRWAGSASKQRSGASAHGTLGIGLLLASIVCSCPGVAYVLPGAVANQPGRDRALLLDSDHELDWVDKPQGDNEHDQT